MTPRYTDRHRWPRGYATAAESREPGYLKAKFDKLTRAEQDRAAVQKKAPSVSTLRSAR